MNMRKQLDTLFWSLERKCESMREWSEMLATIETMERGHRKHRGPFKQPVSVAVRYFACKAVLEPIALPASWVDIAAVRPDYVLGQSIRERAGDLSHLELVWSDLAIDYAADIAGK